MFPTLARRMRRACRGLLDARRAQSRGRRYIAVVHARCCCENNARQGSIVESLYSTRADAAFAFQLFQASPHWIPFGRTTRLCLLDRAIGTAQKQIGYLVCRQSRVVDYDVCFLAEEITRVCTELAR